MTKKTGGTNFGLIPFASVGAGFTLAVLSVLFVVWAGTNSDHRTRVAGIHADRLQQQLNIQLAQIKLQLSSIATSIHLAQVVADTDDSARALEGSALASII